MDGPLMGFVYRVATFRVTYDFQPEERMVELTWLPGVVKWRDVLDGRD